MKKVELLAPSGNFECVKAAVAGGCDAVYLGGRQFNARAYAANFSNEELEEVADYCHSYGVKVYVTVNTIYRNEEINELMSFIDELYEMGIDGLIMQDMGAIKLVRENWPSMPVHVSTQLTVNSAEEAMEFEKLGVRTIVLSRELNLEEIRKICDSTDINIEAFIHGALCVSYSGQCLMSSMAGRRSGNRGRCAQNCRLNYELEKGGKKLAEGHLLSTKDICTLELLPQLLDTGVASLKIEGRMKSPEYVFGVTSIYRRYIDMYYENRDSYYVDNRDMEILKQLFNRGSFSQGYLNTHSGSDMMCPTHPRNWGTLAGSVTGYDARRNMAAITFSTAVSSGDGIEVWTDDEEGAGCYITKPAEKGETSYLRIEGDIRKGQKVYRTYDKKLMDDIDRRIAENDRKVPVSGKLVLRKGRQGILTLNGVTVTGDTVSPAKTAPLSRSDVLGQMSRMGNTIFRLEKLEIDMDDDVFMSKGQLNALRTECLNKLKESIISGYKRERKYPVVKDITVKQKPAVHRLSVLVSEPAQLDQVLRNEDVAVIYLESNAQMMNCLEEMIGKCHAAGKKVSVRLPRIWRDYIRENFSDNYQRILNSSADGFLIADMGHYHTVADSGKEIHFDYTANIINDHSLAFYRGLNAASVTLSVENGLDDLKKFADLTATEILGYGRVEVMITHQCPIGNFTDNKKNRMHCEKYGSSEGHVLKSSRNSYLLKTDCQNCICTIYTARAVNVRHLACDLPCEYVRINLLNENPQQVKEILDSFSSSLHDKNSPEAAGCITDLYNEPVS